MDDVRGKAGVDSFHDKSPLVSVAGGNSDARGGERFPEDGEKVGDVLFVNGA